MFISDLDRPVAAGYTMKKAAVGPFKAFEASLALSGSVACSPVADSPDPKVPERGSSGLPTPAVASASVEHNTVKQGDK